MVPRERTEPTRVRSIRLPTRLWDAVEITAAKLEIKANGLIWRAVEDWLVGQGTIMKEDRSMSEATRIYSATTGGHAPGHLREALLDWIERVYESGGNIISSLQSDTSFNSVGGNEIFYEGPKPLKWLIGQLWNCSDIIPGSSVTEIEELLELYLEPTRNVGTYGWAVRQIAEIVKMAERQSED